MRLWNPYEGKKEINIRVGALRKVVSVNPYEIVSLKIDKEEITAVHDEIVM